MSGEQAVPSPERIAEIIERQKDRYAYDGPGGIPLLYNDLRAALAALATAESERDTARDERDATSETRAELQRSYESEVAELRSALDEAQQRIALVRGVIAEDARLAESTGIPSDGTVLISDV